MKVYDYYDETTNVIAIDPATKSLGVALFRDGILKEAKTIKSSGDDRQARQFDILQQLHSWLRTLGIRPDVIDFVVCEETTFRSRGNNTFQRFLGALEATFFPIMVDYVHAKTLKSYYGDANAKKPVVAERCMHMLETAEEQNILDFLIDAEEWDATDAISIGLYYWHKRLPEKGAVPR